MTNRFRAMAVVGVLLVAAGMGLPPLACAQTAAQGETVGLLFLLAGGSPGHTPRDSSASRQTRDKSVSVKQGRLLAKDGTRPVSNGHQVARTISDRDASHGIHP
jgi:hypothetical protein